MRIPKPVNARGSAGSIQVAISALVANPCSINHSRSQNIAPQFNSELNYILNCFIRFINPSRTL